MKLAALLAAAACSHGDPSPAPPAPPILPTPAWMQDASDLVTAVADDWSSTKVKLSHWMRRSGDSGWDRDGDPWDGVIGDAGIAWGIGLHGNSPLPGPIKKEGDRKAPAGAFRLSAAFGYEADRNSRVGYRQLDDATECVDDPKSASYNLIVEHTGSADWRSAEHMRRPDDLYSLGAIVDHNPRRAPGAGSCIFLHVWEGPDSTTVGCTAMDHDRLSTLLDHLGKSPVFVLLPRAEYSALRDPWGLPPQ